MKRVYTFGNGKAEGRADMKNLLGGKGANLAEMNLIGVPVPPGFTITTEVCTTYTQQGKEAVGGFARSVADRIIFMAEGQVLVDTTDVDGFFDNPTEPRAVQFLSKIIDHNSDRVQVDA